MRHNIVNTKGGGRTVKKKPEDPKRKALREQGALNRHPEKVTDALFEESEFFDPRDLIQVKYEMLRRVSGKDKTASEASRTFGFSRPSFYQAKSAFEAEGLFGLVPKKRGPRGAHKLTEEVLGFLREVLAQEGPLGSQQLAEKIRGRFGLRVHRRTVERALGKKKPR
jgi:transposase